LAAPDPMSPRVTTLADSGEGSLRAVIAKAPPGAVIRFADDLEGGTITLGDTPLVIERDLTIDGRSKSGNSRTGITIDAAGGLLHVYISKASATVGLRGLKFTGGSENGVLSVGATLSIQGCDFSENEFTRGHAVFNKGGRLTMRGCLIAGNNGGAVVTHGEETLLDSCTIADNHLMGAPLIFVRGKFRMVNCTVANNVTDEGAFVVDAYQRLDLEHCTVVGNSAPSCGGIHLWLGAKLYFKNTIIAGNVSTDSGPPNICCVQGGTDILTGGGNFIGNNDGIEWDSSSTPGQQSRLFQDQIGTKDAPIDPMLTPLGDYGGPVPTMPPLSGSPVIDAINSKNAPLAVDARGVKRPIGELYDIGAVEYDSEQDGTRTDSSKK
jgi:hypothetical protein